MGVNCGLQHGLPGDALAAAGAAAAAAGRLPAADVKGARHPKIRGTRAHSCPGWCHRGLRTKGSRRAPWAHRRFNAHTPRCPHSPHAHIVTCSNERVMAPACAANQLVCHLDRVHGTETGRMSEIWHGRNAHNHHTQHEPTRTPQRRSSPAHANTHCAALDLRHTCTAAAQTYLSAHVARWCRVLRTRVPAS